MSRQTLSSIRRAGGSWLCLLLLFLLPPTAVDAQEKKLSWRAVTHTKAVQVIKVGDVDGHVLGVAKFSGLAFFKDGEVGGTGYTVNFDYTKGSGPFNGHATLAFEDGSKIWMRFEGNSVKGNDGITRFEGEYTPTFGGGTYEGIKGTGGFKGQRVSLMEGGGATQEDANFGKAIDDEIPF